MAFDVSFRDTFPSSAKDQSRFMQNFVINESVATDGMRVTQSSTPAMSVQVAVGTAYFYGTGAFANVMYEFNSDAVETVTIPTAAAQPRIDIVCCRVDPSTQAPSLVIVSGSPSGSPAVPATPASHYKLAEVAVAALATTITNSNITDTRRNAFVIAGGARGTGLINGYIVPVVASNNLTLHISTTPYNPSSPSTVTEPTTSNPVGIWIGDTLRFITSALSVTANAGTNWFGSGSSELATQSVDYFAYIGFNATDGLTLGFARIPNARLYSEFNATSTNERFCRISTITNAVAGDNYVNVGRFAATLSAGAGFTWTVPTYTSRTLIEEPIFESRELSWQPTYGATGSMTYTSVTTTEAFYRVLPNGLFRIQLFTQGTTGGTGSQNLTATLPFQGGAGGRQRFTMISQDDTLAGVASCSVSGNVLSVSNYPNGSGGAANFGLGANRRIMGNAILEIR